VTRWPQVRPSALDPYKVIAARSKAIRAPRDAPLRECSGAAATRARWSQSAVVRCFGV